MSTDKEPDNSQSAANQVEQTGDVNPSRGNIESVSGDKNPPDHWPPIRKWAIANWLWILAHSINFLYALIQLSSAGSIPVLTLVIITCIIFVQIYTDPVELSTTNELAQEKRKSQQRYRWMVFAYSFMLMSLVLAFYPFINPFLGKPDAAQTTTTGSGTAANQPPSKLHDSHYIKTLRERPIAVFVGCSSNNEHKSLSCKPKTDHAEAPEPPISPAGTWILNIGGHIKACHEKEEDDGYGESVTCEVNNGLLVPLYFIILALMGGSISLTRRLPELQKQASKEHIATEQQPKLTQHEFREHLIFQIVQFISAPFLAILAYYLIEPNNTTNAVALAFTAGFASETILLMVRSVANKITPAASMGPQYGAVAGVVTMSDKNTDSGKPGQKIEVFLSESPQVRTVTDEKGFYMLGNVPVGEHSISIKFTTTVDAKEVEKLQKDTVKIERAHAIVKKNVTINAEDAEQK